MSFNRLDPNELLELLWQQVRQQQAVVSNVHQQYQAPAPQISTAPLNALSSLIADYLKTHGALASNIAATPVSRNDAVSGTIQLSTDNSSGIQQQVLTLLNSMKSETTQNLNPGQTAGIAATLAASSSSPSKLASFPLHGQRSNASVMQQQDILSGTNKELVADVLKKQAMYSHLGVQVSIQMCIQL